MISALQLITVVFSVIAMNIQLPTEVFHPAFPLPSP